MLEIDYCQPQDIKKVNQSIQPIANAPTDFFVMLKIN